MLYYSVTMYTNKLDDIKNAKTPFIGGVKCIKWLRYSGNDNELKFGEDREDEKLAINIMLQNLRKQEVVLMFTNDPSIDINEIGKIRIETKNEADLIELLYGQYQKVIVSKYESDLNIRV